MDEVFFDYDPVATARTVQSPVLILNGAKDRQVTPAQVPQLEAAFKAGGDTDVTTHIFPNTDHEFMYDTVGDPEGYAKLKLPHQMQPMVVGTVVDWLVKRLEQDHLLARPFRPTCRRAYARGMCSHEPCTFA